MSNEVEEASYNDLNKENLQEIANEWNESHNLESGDDAYIPVSQKKKALISDIEEMEAISEGLINVEKEERIAKVPLSQLEINEQNYRHKGDYYDADLQIDIDEKGGLIDPMKVRPTEQENEAGETIYVPISGNRRLYNLKQVAEKNEVEFAEKDVPVVIVETEGSDKEKSVDEIVNIYKANEDRLDLSTINKVEAMVDLEKKGMSRKAIAEQLGKSRAYVSQIMPLQHLPQRVKDLVHFEQQEEHYSEKSRDELTDLDVPFEENEDGEIEIKGITLSNAQEMTKKYPASNASNAEEKRAEVNEFLTRRDLEFVLDGESVEGGVIRAAQELSKTKFQNTLDNLYSRVFEDNEEEAEEESSDTEDSSQEESKEEKDASDVNEDGPDIGDTEDEDEDVESFEEGVELEQDQAEVAAKITDGDIVLADDWEQQFEEELIMGNEDMAHAVAALLEFGVLVDVEQEE